jgi:hypothetical protein
MTPSFAATKSDAELLALLGALAAGLHPNNPMALTQPEFDANKPSDYPAAKQVCRRLSMHWQQAIEMAIRKGGNPTHVIGIRTRVPRDPGASIERCADALRIVAAEIGADAALPDGYRTGRQQLLKKRSGQSRKQMASRLPTVGQISRLGWRQVVQEAEITAASNARRGMTMADILEIFIEERGYIPPSKELHRFGQEQNIAIARKGRGNMTDAIEEVRRRHPARWLPETFPPQKNRPEWDATKISRRPNITEAIRTDWTLDDIKKALRVAIDLIGPGVNLTQAHYRQLSRTNADLPSASTIGRIAQANQTTFSALRDEVAAENT